MNIKLFMEETTLQNIDKFTACDHDFYHLKYKMQTINSAILGIVMNMIHPWRYNIKHP